MPRGKKDNGKSKVDPNAGRRYYCEPEAAWGGYVDLSLDDGKRLDFTDWFQSHSPEAMQLLTDALGEGMAFGCKWDAANQCFLATFTGAGVANSNERYVLTARSDQMAEAMALLVYKHSVLMEGDWGGYRPATRGLRQWG